MIPHAGIIEEAFLDVWTKCGDGDTQFWSTTIRKFERYKRSSIGCKWVQGQKLLVFYRQVSVGGPTNLFGTVLMLSRYSCVFSVLTVSLNDMGQCL